MSYDPFHPDDQKDDSTVTKPYDPFAVYRKQKDEEEDSKESTEKATVSN